MALSWFASQLTELEKSIEQSWIPALLKRFRPNPIYSPQSCRTHHDPFNQISQIWNRLDLIYSVIFFNLNLTWSCRNSCNSLRNMNTSGRISLRRIEQNNTVNHDQTLPIYTSMLIKFQWDRTHILRQAIDRELWATLTQGPTPSTVNQLAK